MGTYVILLILIVCVIFAFLSSSQHFKGQGGCCGGGETLKKVKPKKLKKPMSQKIIHIEGMHCKNCQTKVTHALHEHEHLKAKVDLNKKVALVWYDEYIDDSELISIVNIETK